MAELLWLNHLSSCVSLNGSNVQLCIARILTILESCLVASFPDEVHPVSVSELASSITSDFEPELWTCEFPMNRSICFSFSRILMSYQFTDKFRDLGFPFVSTTEFVGGYVLPNSLMNRNAVF